MKFNQEEITELCEELGIKMVEGNVPLMNGVPITENDFKDLFKPETEEEYTAYLSEEELEFYTEDELTIELEEY